MSEAVTNDLISDLHTKKQMAIESLDFEVAEELHAEIQNQIQRRALSQIEQIQYESMKNLEKIQRNHTQALLDLAEQKRRLDARLYTKFQVIFEETQEDHIQQLMDLEKERGLTLLDESEKPVEEQILLLEQAKNEAVLTHFDVAKNLRQRAREVGEAELEARRQKVETDYIEKKEQMLEQHKLDLEQITKLHEEEITKMKKECEENDKKEELVFSNAVKNIIHEAGVRFQACTTNNETKEKAINELQSKMDESMNKYKAIPLGLPKPTKSEQMRITSLCPSNAAMNQVKDEPPEQLMKRADTSAAKRATRTGLRQPKKASTGLISRAFTATIGRR